MGFTLNSIDALIVGVSILLVVIVGLWAARRQGSSAHDYFLASGKMPWWIIGSAFVSTSVSSEQIVGTIGSAYENGMGIANWEWWSLPPYIVLIAIFIPIYLRNKIATVPELISRRFSPFCGDIYCYFMLFAYVFIFLAPVLYGGTLTIAELTGANFHLILWCMVILVALYTVKGGLTSVMWTDALQCVMLLGGGLLLFFVSLHKIPGGWEAMITSNPDRFHLYHPVGDPIAPFAGLVAGTFGLFIFYQATNQLMVQRVLGACSTWDGIMGIIFAGLINMLRPLVTCFLGFIVYHWIHNMEQAAPLENLDTAFPFALKTFAPEWGLRGIVLAGFLAAVMSTISALANSTSTLFALDLYRKIINRDADDARVVRVGRISALAALILAAVIAPYVKELRGIFLYFQTGVTYIATPFVPVILLGILWKRTTHEGALSGLIGGIVIQILVIVAAWAIGLHWHWLYLGCIAEALVFILVIVVSLATPPPAR